MHVTLETGHSRRSYRSEVADGVVVHLRKQIEEMLSGGGVEIRPGYQMAGAAHGAALVASVHSGDMPLVTIGVAARSQVSARLWEEMVNIAPTADIVRPEAPWCAVRVYPLLLADPFAASWIGDFGICLAWAWLERDNG